MGCNQSSNAVAEEQPKVVAAPASAGAQQVDAEPAKHPLVTGHYIDTNGVVLYHVEFQNVVAKKRFNDFKLFHEGLKDQVPPLPAAGFSTVLNRRNDNLIEERRARFQEILAAAPEAQVITFLGIEAQSQPKEEPTEAA
ncbi:unnamed protein product [Aphanomyces euteiches]|uniref:PX domain-containing protein n=1 Tax=Aphanomyces euteiches TaxID=100861 RepID=A0A6G0XPW4_9STRA|nr:hypothetical protein Ae201684_002626 [Aphanomyces euteiches]KAH9092553.1 hypothetical protein Ae201684P_008227 [Aphanomyces euteiches]KAH9143176.1 hypothetical protein AeRB84_012806 [Aphanomyces euteiches]